MIRTLTTVAALAIAFIAVAAPAAAQDATAAGSWSFAVGAATDNRSKAISKSDGQAFVWADAEWSSASGLFYAGSGIQTIDTPGDSELELAVGAGVRPQIAGFDLDLNLTHKQQLDSNPGVDDTAWEVSADLKRSIGPASGRLRVQYSADGLGPVQAWTWTEAQLGWAFDARLRASAAVGRREQDDGPDYTGWNVGVAYAVTRDIEAELRYHATDADIPGAQFDDALVAGISFAF